MDALEAIFYFYYHCSKLKFVLIDYANSMSASCLVNLLPRIRAQSAHF